MWIQLLAPSFHNFEDSLYGRARTMLADQFLQVCDNEALQFRRVVYQYNSTLILRFSLIERTRSILNVY